VADSQTATVFIGGTVFTGLGQPSYPAAVAIRGGRIVAVGDSDAVREAAGTAPDIVDLAGGLLLPGFQDAHVHPVYAGVLLLQCDLHELSTADEYLAEIGRYARSHPDQEWITGGGWALDAFPGGTPSRQLLDAVVPDRPVLLPCRDGHSSWVNSRALALAGIDRHTPDPADGRIERDENGDPSGMLHEGAMFAVGRLLPTPSPAELDAGLVAAQAHLFSLGITAWQDALVGTFNGFPDPYEAYLRAAKSGVLKARVIGALWWDRERGAEQIPDIIARRAGGQVGRFAATSVKIMQDGITENFTAGMTEPYRDACGCTTANAGLSFVDPVELCSYVTQLDAAGFQVHFHALGDRAVREALDAVEAARKANGPNDHRHHLAHIQVVHPHDVPRFADLDAVANMQPLWACHEKQMDELTIPFLGVQLADWQYPFGDIARSGARLAVGSDWPVSSPNPMWGVHVAVNRRPPGRELPPFLPAQALDLAEVLTAHTAGSAYVNHLEHETGTVEPGKYADLVVLDRDPFKQPADRIGDCRVLRTYVQGELVYTTDH
jgi:predicted amidohydrolase YtcJ